MKLNKRLKKVFIEHKASYIGMIILLIMSAAVFLGFNTAVVSIDKNVKDNRINQNVEDADFTLLKPLTDDEIKRYENDFGLIIQNNPYLEKENGYNGAAVKTIPIPAEINLPKVYEGEYFKEENDVMVDRYFFAAQNFAFGDRITIYGTDYTIRGTFTTPDYLSLTHLDTDFISDGKKFGLVMMSKNNFEKLPMDDANTNYSVKFSKDNTDDFRRELAKSSFVTEWNPKDTNKRITTYDGESGSIILMSCIAPVFLLIISTVILSVVLSRMLKKEYPYIGTLSAMGYSKRQIYSHYFRLPVITTLLGSVIGLVIGYFLIDPFSLSTTTEYNIPKPEYYINYWNIVLIIAVPLVLNSLAVILTVNRALKLNIVTLLKSDSNSKAGLKKISRFLPQKLPFRIRFKTKEILTNLPRSFLMFIGVLISAFLMLTGFLFYGSFDFIYSSNFSDLYGYKYQYVYKAPQTENKTSGEPYMMASFYCKTNGKAINFTVNGIPENAEFIRPKNESGEYIDTSKTIVSKSVAKRLGWEKGDKLTIVSNANLKETDITVDEICDIKYNDYIYMPMSKLNEILGLDKNTHIGVYTNDKLDIDEKTVSDILTKEDSEAGLESAIAAFRTLIYILGVIAAIISLIVVYIVTSLLIDENRKNISLLKVMGYRNKDISSLLLNSTSVIAWLGFAAAIPVTVRVINIFFDTLTENMFFDFTSKLHLNQVVFSFLLVIGVYYLTLLICRKKVYRINMAESLKAKE